MNSKGQALVEFVIILPITLLLIFTIIDFGRVIALKSELQNVASDAVTMYQNGKTDAEIKNFVETNETEKNLNFDISKSDKYATIKVSKTITSMTPGLTKIAKNV